MRCSLYLIVVKHFYVFTFFIKRVLAFLARDAFAKTNRRAIAMMSARLSVRQSVYLERACIVIIYGAS